MTVVAVWLNKEQAHESLWAVADSQLSEPNKSGLSYSAIFKNAGKLLGLRVCCFRRSRSEPLLRKLHTTTTIGFAFAGSSILGNNVYNYLSQSLGNLCCFDVSPGSNSNDITLRLADVANHACSVLKEMTISYAEFKSDLLPPELSIFGFCPFSKKLRLFSISPAEGFSVNAPGTISYKVVEEGVCSDGFVYLMGDRKSEILERINEERIKVYGTVRWNRVPERVVRSLIEDPEFNTIGGKPQFGLADYSGFRLMGYCEPYVPGQPRSRLLYQGVDLDNNKQLRFVGNMFFDMVAIV